MPRAAGKVKKIVSPQGRRDTARQESEAATNGQEAILKRLMDFRRGAGLFQLVGPRFRGNRLRSKRELVEYVCPRG